jgi:hypothetical protein
LRLIQAPAGTRFEIRADGLDFDPPVTFDLDRRHSLSDGGRPYQHGSDWHRQHHQGGQQASSHPHSNIDAQRALAISDSTVRCGCGQKISETFLDRSKTLLDGD